MRHIASLFAGLIIAPIAWLLIGAGTTGLDPNGLYQETAGRPNAAIAMAMFAGAGILLGLLAVSRMSPTGPLVITVFFGAAFALYRFTSFNFSLPVSFQSMKVPAEASEVAGSSGVVMIIAALMLVTVLFPSRWRGKKTDEDREVDAAALATSSSGFPKQPTSEAIDPFAPNSQTAMLGADHTPIDDRGQGYESQTPAQPFGSVQSGERSPYADDGYGSDNYAGYEQPRDAQPPRYGETQQQYADDGYGNQSRQYR